MLYIVDSFQTIMMHEYMYKCAFKVFDLKMEDIIDISCMM